MKINICSAFKNQKGAISIIMVVLAISALLAISSVLFVSSLSERRLSAESLRSLQALYAAESGMEDILARFKNGWICPDTYRLSVGSASTTIVDFGLVGNSRTITATGQSSGRIRRISTNYSIDREGIGFNYGAQAGDGGITLQNSCSIIGDIYSNGPIQGQGNHLITGNVIVAKTTGYINDTNILGNVNVAQCQNKSDVIGTLTAGSFSNCTYTSSAALTGTIPTTTLPITDEQIAEWKADAEAGGTYTGNYTFSTAGETRTLGPLKIIGNLTIDKNNCTLIMTGAIWVTGTVTIKSSTIRLSSTYGETSGMLIADGLIDLQTTSQTTGSGQSGSYFLLISTKSGIITDPAIKIGQSYTGDIVFANNGWIEVGNSTDIQELTGYGISLTNGSGLVYDSAIASAAFSAGPGATWNIVDWVEIE